jgi:hypothetical protein
VNTTEQTAKTSHAATGLFALLHGLFRVQGTGAPARVARRAFPAVFAALLLVAVMSAPALAERAHIFCETCTLGKGPGSGAGEMHLRAAGEEVEGSEVAVNSTTHDVYVADTENHSVDEFEADGTFVRAWGWGVGGGVGFQECTPTSLGGCHAGVSGPNPGEFEAPTFIAIDNSPGGDGDVYVGDTANNIVTKFSSVGALESGWGTAGQLNGSTATSPPGVVAGPFGSLAGIVVDSAGTLDVFQTGNPGVLFQFSQAGTFVTDFETPRGSDPAGLAVNSAGDFFKVDGSGAVEEFGPGGVDIGQVAGEVSATGVAVDSSTGDLYVDSGDAVDRYAFNASGEVIEPGGTCQVEHEGSITRVPTGFDGCNPTETFGSGAFSGGAGLAVDSSNAHVYVADAATNQIDLFTPEPASAPLIRSTSVSEVTNDSATVTGEIDPNSFTGEPATEYQVEYITEAAYQANLAAALAPFTGAVPAPEAADSLPAEFAYEPTAPIHIQGLLAGTVYHYRITAHNNSGKTEGEPGERGEELTHTFTTSPKGEFVLPDGRQWQLVSPPNKQGALIEPIGIAGLIQAAAGGDAITYAADAPTEANPAGYVVYQQVLSTRGPEGWSTRDIEPPHVGSTGVSAGGQEFRFFSEDLSSAVVQPFGAFDPADSPEEASEQTAFRRMNFPAGNPGEVCTSSCLHPLVTGAPGFANVTPGTTFGNEAPCAKAGGATVFCGPEFVGATPELDHVMLKSIAPLTTGAPENTVVGGLYEWSAGKAADQQLSLVSVLPNGEVVEGFLGTHESTNTRGAVSEDGSRVVWYYGSGSGGHLYLRVNATEPQSPLSGEVCTVAEDACTIELDQEVEELGGTPGTPEFQLASKGVAGVLFTDGGDLYEYVVAERHLKRLTENAEALGTVIGASPDDSFIYFVANGVLGDAGERGAAQGNCPAGGASTEAAQRCNLYVDQDGVVKLVAVLSGADSPDSNFGGNNGALNKLTARVSPNGEWLAFMSQRSLTGYDNRDAASGEPDEEVFEYNAVSERVVCASCDPTGARPHGVEYGKEGNANAGEEMPLAGGYQVWPGTTWLAANVPGWTPYDGLHGQASYQSRYLSDSGRLFFNSRDGLVSKDVNRQGDVYEYEPEGVGNERPAAGGAGVVCGPQATSGSDVFEPEREYEVEGRKGESGAGCVALISKGTSPSESAFLDASESGGDVFFLTAEKLVPQDTDDALDVYDAQECTTEVPCAQPAAVPPPPCNTEASCKAAPSSQPELFGPSGSATFSGPGNLAPAVAVNTKAKPLTRAQKLAKALKSCRKDKKKSKRQACEKQARAKYGPTKAKKKAKAKKSDRASNDRGTK